MARVFGILKVNDRLEFTLSSCSTGGTKSCTMRLTRVGAQQLADALLDYCGTSVKGGYRPRDLAFPADDLDPVPVPRPVFRGVVRVGSGTSRHAVVKLRR